MATHLGRALPVCTRLALKGRLQMSLAATSGCLNQQTVRFDDR